MPTFCFVLPNLTSLWISNLHAYLPSQIACDRNHNHYKLMPLSWSPLQTHLQHSSRNVLPKVKSSYCWIFSRSVDHNFKKDPQINHSSSVGHCQHSSPTPLHLVNYIPLAFCFQNLRWYQTLSTLKYCTMGMYRDKNTNRKKYLALIAHVQQCKITSPSGSSSGNRT